jgi:hypothetical protein
LDTVMVPTSPEGSVGPHSYWVQLAVEGRTWLLFPYYWVAIY